MRIIFLCVVFSYFQCSPADKNNVGDDNKFYPRKVNDTFYYSGNFGFQCTVKNIDTVYHDTMYVVRLHLDSIVFLYRKLSFFDKNDTISIQESWEFFHVTKKFEVKIDDKYTKYDINYVFKEPDSLSYDENEIDKLPGIIKYYSFNGRRVLQN